MFLYSYTNGSRCVCAPHKDKMNRWMKHPSYFTQQGYLNSLQMWAIGDDIALPLLMAKYCFLWILSIQRLLTSFCACISYKTSKVYWSSLCFVRSVITILSYLICYAVASKPSNQRAWLKVFHDIWCNHWFVMCLFQNTLAASTGGRRRIIHIFSHWWNTSANPSLSAG